MTTTHPSTMTTIDAPNLAPALPAHLHRWILKARMSNGGLYQCQCGHTRTIEYGD